MRIDDNLRDGKLQYNSNRKGGKISVLSSGKIDKYEYLTGGETKDRLSDKVIQQAKFTYSTLGKALEKQRKTIEDQGRKQVDSITHQKRKD